MGFRSQGTSGNELGFSKADFPDMNTDTRSAILFFKNKLTSLMVCSVCEGR